MSKQVRGQLPGGVKINETDLAVLMEIDRRSVYCPWGVPIALDDLSECVERTKVTTRRSCKSLESQGLIEVHLRYRVDGGRMENEYAVAPLGREVLEYVASRSSDEQKGEGADAQEDGGEQEDSEEHECVAAQLGAVQACGTAQDCGLA